MTRTPVRIPVSGAEWAGSVPARLSPVAGRVRWRRSGSADALRHFRDGIPRLVWNMVALEGGTMTPAEVHTLLSGVTVGGYLLDEERRVLELSARCTTLARDVEAGAAGEEAGAVAGAAAGAAGGAGDEQDGDVVGRALARYVRAVAPVDGHRDLAAAQLGLAADLLPAGYRVPLVPRSRKVELDHALAALDAGDATELSVLLRDCAVL